MYPSLFIPHSLFIQKARLLSYLSRGEKQRFQQKRADLLETSLSQTDATLAEYKVGHIHSVTHSYIYGLSGK